MRSIKFIAIVLLFTGWPYFYLTETQANSDQHDNVDTVYSLNKKFEKLLYKFPSQAVSYAEKALRISQRIHDQKGIASSYYNIGMYYERVGDYNKAKDFFNSSLIIWQQLNDRLSLGNTLLALGDCYQAIGDLKKAASYLKEGAQVMEKLSDRNSMVLANNALGFLYERNNRYDSALHFYSLSKRLINKEVSPKVAGNTYIHVGNIYFRSEKYDSALHYYQLSLAQYKSGENLNGISDAYGNIGTVFCALGKNDSALANYKLALDIKKQLDDKQGIIEASLNIGVLYNDTGKFQRALKYYFPALQLAKMTSQKQLISELYLNIYKTYANMGKYAKAFEYSKLYNSLQDSLDNEDNHKALAQMLAQYETEKKQNQIKLLQQQQAIAKGKMRIRNFQLVGTMGGLVVAMLVLGLLIVNYRQRTRTQQALNERRIADLLKDQELKSISAMLEGQEQERKRIAEDLHDRLGSLLSTVKLHFAAFGNNLRTKELEIPQYASANVLLDEACEEVRRIAHNMLSGVLVQFGLVPALRELADSIESSSDIKVNVSAFGLDERLESRVEIEIYRIIQELVNNILKHAQASEINIQLTRQDSLLNIMVEDNGQGFDTSDVRNSKGIGLKNMAYRAEKIGGSFQIDSYPGKGTTAVIEIPLS